MKIIYKFILVQIFLAGYLYLIVSIIGGSIYYDEWNNIANLFFIPLETGYLIQFGQMLKKHTL